MSQAFKPWSLHLKLKTVKTQESLKSSGIALYMERGVYSVFNSMLNRDELNKFMSALIYSCL